MKEYIKLFNNSQSADGYVINDIPFTCTAISGGGTGNINLRCNEEDKKLEVDGDTIEIVDVSPVVPSDEIWYTSLDGNIVTPYETSYFPTTIVSNTYVGGKGIIKFAADVTSIGNYAFRNCSGLISVTIPNSVTSIGQFAFSGCTSLTSITIPNSATYIGGGAFWYCSSLTSVTIPNSVTSIENGTFEDCSGLTSVVIPNSATYIGESAFSNCTSLTSVTIPNGVTFIDSSAFAHCTSLTSVTIPNGVESIESFTFQGCTGLTSVTIPNSVAYIGNCAFYKCSSLTSVTIPNSVTEIGTEAFQCGYNGAYEGSLQTITVVETDYTYDGESEYFTITLGNGSVNELKMYESGE